MLTPRAIRIRAHIAEEYAAAEAGVSRNTLRLYEACPERIKTPAKRWLLDQYYGSLQRLLEEAEQRRQRAAEGNYPEPDEPLSLSA